MILLLYSCVYIRNECKDIEFCYGFIRFESLLCYRLSSLSFPQSLHVNTEIQYLVTGHDRLFLTLTCSLFIIIFLYYSPLNSVYEIR
jgi:hypothetical protein